MKLIGFGNNQDLLAMWFAIDICYLDTLSISSLQVSCLGIVECYRTFISCYFGLLF